MTLELGKLHGVSLLDYHAADAFSNSRLKDFLRLPLLYQRRYITKELPRRETTPALAIGQALDWLLLEGVEAYKLRTAVQPETYESDDGIKPWHNGARVCKAWNAANAGRTILGASEASQVEEMAQTALADADIAALLEHGHPGITWRAKFGPAVGQCRTDWYNPDGVILPSTGTHTGPYFVELKSCRSLLSGDFGHFEKQFAQLKYHLQVALYREIIREVMVQHMAMPRGTPYLRCFVVAVDKNEIPLAKAFEPSTRCMTASHAAILKIVGRLLRCYETGVWPGLKPGIGLLDIPPWEETALELL